MKFNKKVQYGILLGLYLSRSGTATLKDVAENLGLSLSVLEQVSRVMRIAGLVTVKTGPGGGSTLVKGVTVGQIAKCFSEDLIVRHRDHSKLRASVNVEDRAFALFIDYMLQSLSTTMSLQIDSICEGLTIKEMNILDRLDSTGLDS